MKNSNQMIGWKIEKISKFESIFSFKETNEIKLETINTGPNLILLYLCSSITYSPRMMSDFYN